MRDLWPVARANALAAAGFGLIVALLGNLVTQNQWILILVTVGYVLLLNRWLTRLVQPPAPIRPRKGSHKPSRGQGWKVAKWTLQVVGVGMVVQMGVFVGVYTGVSLLLEWVRGRS